VFTSGRRCATRSRRVRTAARPADFRAQLPRVAAEREGFPGGVTVPREASPAVVGVTARRRDRTRSRAVAGPVRRALGVTCHDDIGRGADADDVIHGPQADGGSGVTRQS
jgi:hypothetical protein